jgi:hypothetical protein
MRRKTWIGLVVIALAGMGLLAVNVRSQTPERPPAANKQASSPTSNQVLMREKLTAANKALDGLAVEDFAKVAESAKLMAMISKAASWHVLATEEYTRHSKNFQEQAADLERHAKEKNLEAAALDYMRISLTCVQCHKYVRETRKKEKP